MAYNMIYAELRESFQDMMVSFENHYLQHVQVDPTYKEVLTNTWLWEFDESTLEDAERLNVLLPLIKWSVTHSLMTPFLEHELSSYHRDYINGKLYNILADYEAKEVIADLVWCYQTHFAKK